MVSFRTKIEFLKVEVNYEFIKGDDDVEDDILLVCVETMEGIDIIHHLNKDEREKIMKECWKDAKKRNYDFST